MLEGSSKYDRLVNDIEILTEAIVWNISESDSLGEMETHVQ